MLCDFSTAWLYWSAVIVHEPWAGACIQNSLCRSTIFFMNTPFYISSLCTMHIAIALIPLAGYVGLGGRASLAYKTREQ